MLQQYTGGSMIKNNVLYHGVCCYLKIKNLNFNLSSQMTIFDFHISGCPPSWICDDVIILQPLHS